MFTLLLLVRCASADWAVVTGASSGIGEQLALQAAQRGYDVVLHGRRRGALHRLKKAIEAQTGRSTKMVVEDLSRRNGAKRLHAACAGLDVRLLFANAGVARVKPFIEDDVDAMLALNVHANTDLCRRFGKDMAQVQTRAADLTELGMFPATDTTTDMPSEDKGVVLATHYY